MTRTSERSDERATSGGTRAAQRRSKPTGNVEFAEGAETTGHGESANIVFLPAMGVAASFYRPFLEDLARECGAAVQALDLPGQGTSPLRAANGDDFGYREVVEEQIPAALHEAARSRPGRPLVLAGHSLGGQLAILASCGPIPPLAGIALIAAGTAHWRSWPAGHRWRAWATVRAIDAMSRILPWYPGARVGFGGNQARRFMRDWSHNARSGRYRLSGAQRSAEELASELTRVRTPILALSIANDPVAPPGATAELVSHVPAAAVTRAEARAIVEHAPWRRHFSWARAHSDVTVCVAEWVRETAVPR